MEKKSANNLYLASMYTQKFHQEKAELSMYVLSQVSWHCSIHYHYCSIVNKNTSFADLFFHIQLFSSHAEILLNFCKCPLFWESIHKYGVKKMEQSLNEALRLETTFWLMMIPIYALELSYFMCSEALLRVGFSHRINSKISFTRTPN